MRRMIWWWWWWWWWWCWCWWGMVILVTSWTAVVPPWVMSQTLSPLGNIVPITSTAWFDQAAFDASTMNLYLTDYQRHTILRVAQAPYQPLVPSTAAPWKATVFVGQDGLMGLPSLAELPPNVARFTSLRGVIGWPSYGAAGRTGIKTTSTTATTTAAKNSSDGDDEMWIGLWISDYSTNTIHYVNFQRGNNVTLVAGDRGASGGWTDGLWTDAKLMLPFHLAWALLPTDVVTNGVDAMTTTPGDGTPRWTSVIYWADWQSNCLRQGAPLHLRTLSLLDGSFSESLADMVLNVTTFAGLCGSNGFTASAPAYQRAVLTNPYGIVVVNPFRRLLAETIPSNCTAACTVVFVSDWGTYRVSIITPMYPAKSRWITTISREAAFAGGITVARIFDAQARSGRPNGAAGLSASIELFVGMTTKYINVTVTLGYDASTSLSSPVVMIIMNSSRQLTTTNMVAARHMVLLPHYMLPAPPSTSTSGSDKSINGTLVVMFGNSLGIAGVNGLQFYCCLPASYSDYDASRNFLPLDDLPTTATTTSVSVRTTTKSTSVLSSRSPTHSRTKKSSDTLSARGHSGTLIRHGVILSRTGSSSALRLRSSFTRPPLLEQSASLPPPHKVNQRASVSRKRVSSTGGLFIRPADAKAATVVAASMAAGVAGGLLTPGAASKAAVAGRALSVRQCSVVGPAQAAANDPAQFLSFGVALGSADGDGGARAALLLTTLPRVAVLIAMAAAAVMWRPAEAMGVVTAVSVGYFTPNVAGLSTAVVLSSASAASTMACAAVALLGEAAMVLVVCVGVWRPASVALASVAREFVKPIRRRRRWYYRVAGLEDVAAATLIAVCSNVPRNDPAVCTRVVWALLAIAALHLLYVAALRPYRTLLDNGVSIFLALVNAVFALLCCVIARDDRGDVIISAAVDAVAACFYASLAVSVVVTVWEVFTAHRRRQGQK